MEHNWPIGTVFRTPLLVLARLPCTDVRPASSGSVVASARTTAPPRSNAAPSTLIPVPNPDVDIAGNGEESGWKRLASVVEDELVRV